jgi:hypothetical protein
LNPFAAGKRLNKRLFAIIALVTVACLVIAIVALSESYIQLNHRITPQPTVTPTATQTATTNLSSATPDTANYISINVTAVNHAHFPNQWMPSYYIHITNNGASPITVISIINTAIDDQTNFTYWSGKQDISPNTTENFTANNSYYVELPMNEIYAYYEVSGQLYVHRLAPVPLPTSSAT